MSDSWGSPSFTWVHRRKQSEDHLAQSSESLWHDVKAAIQDACRAFNELYGNEANQTYLATPNNDHRIRVSSQTKEHTVDVDFNREALTITADYHRQSFSSKIYRITADTESAFIVDETAQRVTPDGLSETVLKPMFFTPSGPTGSVYQKRGLLNL